MPAFSASNGASSTPRPFPTGKIPGRRPGGNGQRGRGVTRRFPVGNTGRGSPVRVHKHHTSLRDGALDIVRGRLAQGEGNADRALELFQSAMIKPSVVTDLKPVRSDALYCTARIRTDQHKAAPSAETRLQALNAWLALKKHHASEPGSARFREANAAMAEIQ
jgi:hypothetical protein